MSVYHLKHLKRNGFKKLLGKVTDYSLSFFLLLIIQDMKEQSQPQF